MSTMIDNRWDPRFQNQQGPITSGFVSNSDIRQKEKQEQIKWERQREYEDMMNKPPVYYKTGGVSEMSLPLGKYEESRRFLDDERQRDYNMFMTQKKEAENKRREELYMNARQNYKPPPEPDMYDHNQISKDLREERRNEYQDYLKKKQLEESSRIGHRHRYTPPGGLPIGQYDIQRKKLQDQLRNEYKESLLKQRQDQLVFRAKEFQLDAAPEYLGNLNEERPLVGSPSPRNFSEVPRYQREQDNILNRRRVPPTPPGGLNIATEQERKRVEDMKKSIYRDELLKQQKEQMLNKAQQQGEIPVLNRYSPTQAPLPQSSPRGRPPPHPDSGRRRGPPPQDDRMGQNSMEQLRQTPNFWNEGRQAPTPKSVDSQKVLPVEDPTASEPPKSDNSQNKIKQPPGERRPQEETRTGFFDDRRQTPPNRDDRQLDYNRYLAEQKMKDEMKRQKLDELRQAPPPGVNKGDYYNSDTYAQKRQSLNSERREEYQNFLSKNYPQYRHQTPRYGLPIGQYKYDPFRKSLEKQRNREYNDFLEKKNSGQSENNVPSLHLGLPLYQEKYDVHYKTLKQRRNEEYNQLLEETNRPSYRQYTPESMQGLPINQQRYDQAKRAQEIQRNKEYNEHLAKKGEKFTSEDEMLTKRDMTLKKYMDNQLKSEMQDQQEPPKERNKEFGSPGAVLFTGEYEKTRQKVREERTKDYHEYLKKYGHQPPRRQPDQPNSIGFMANLGVHEKERDKLNKEKRDEYNKFLDEKAYGKEGMPRGRPNWVDGKDSWYNQEPPPFNKSPGPGRDQEQHRDRPSSLNRRRPSPSYQEILDSKRKQEASYRRFEDPEYSRNGGPGPAPGGPSDGYNGRYD